MGAAGAPSFPTGAAGSLGAAGMATATGGAGTGGVPGHVPGWVNRTPSTLSPSWPTGRRDPAMAYDVANGRVLLYGGYAVAEPVQDTWLWDGGPGTWTRIAVAPPSVFDAAGVTYDSRRGRVVLFGGEYFPGAAPSAELWEWDGAKLAWTNRPPTGTVAPPQKWPLLAYEPDRAVVVMLGQFAGLSTAEWDPTANLWSNRPNQPTPLPNGGAFAWDVGRRRGVFFGGQTGAETWEYDGWAGTWSPITVTPAIKPSPRVSAAMAYDAAFGRVVLYGGSVGGMPVGDLWEWDGEAARWNELDAGASPRSPGSRMQHRLVYDAHRDCLVLFGGASLTEEPRELWEWTRP